MPQYQVWYKGNAEPWEFAAIGRLSDAEIVGKILEHEHLAGDSELPLSEIIPRLGLAPVKYTMDESEMMVIA